MLTRLDQIIMATTRTLQRILPAMPMPHFILVIISQCRQQQVATPIQIVKAREMERIPLAMKQISEALRWIPSGAVVNLHWQMAHGQIPVRSSLLQVIAHLEVQTANHAKETNRQIRVEIPEIKFANIIYR